MLRNSTTPPPAADPSSLEYQAQWLARKRLARAGIPPKYAGCTLDNYQTPTRAHALARDAMARWIAGPAPNGPPQPLGLLLTGRTGSGKTHLAVAALKIRIAQGVEARFANVADLLLEIKRSWRDDPFNATDEGGEADYTEATEAPLVLLDDLGAERLTGWALERIYLIVNRRYDANLPIIITSNLPWPDEFCAAMGERVGSRLIAMCQIVNIKTTRDWRVKNND